MISGIPVDVTAALQTGLYAAGPGIPLLATIASVAPGQVMLSGAVTATAAGGAIQFSGDTAAPSPLFDFDPVAGTMSQMSLPLTTAGPQMLILPTGLLLLLSGESPQLWVYTPDGAPSPALLPSITSVAANVGGVYTLTGTQLSGQNADAAFGDDLEADENFPVISLVAPNGNIYYALTYNWSSTSVGISTTLETVNFTLPASIPEGVYSLIVSAAGISSNPYSFTLGTPPQLQLAAATSTASPTVSTDFTYTFTVTNTGPMAATNVQVAASFTGNPVQVTTIAISAGSCAVPPQVSCTVPSLAESSSAMVTVHATAAAAGPAQAAVNVTSGNATPQSAQVTVNVQSPPGTLLFSTALTTPVGTGTPVAAAIGGGSVYVLAGDLETFQGASLAPQAALPAGVSPAGLVLSGGNPVVLDQAGNLTAYVSGSAVQSLPANPNATGMTAMNLGGNGSVDLAVIGDNGIALFKANGDGTFSPGAVFDIPGRQAPLAVVAAGSYTGAGLDDLLVADTIGNLWLLPSDGMGGFGNPVQKAVGANPVALAVGDFNGDGKLDLALGNGGSSSVTLLAGDGAGNLTAAAASIWVCRRWRWPRPTSTATASPTLRRRCRSRMRSRC